MIQTTDISTAATGIYLCRPKVANADLNTSLPVVYIDNSYPDIYTKIGEATVANYSLNKLSMFSEINWEEESDFTGQIANYWAIFKVS